MLEATLRVVESKREEGERLIALAPILARELEAHYQESPYRRDGLRLRPSDARLEARARVVAGEFRAALKVGGITEHLRPFHDARHAALTNMAATGASPVAVMATAGHRSMQTTKQYLHLAGVVFRDESAALEQMLLGVQDPVQTAQKRLYTAQTARASACSGRNRATRLRRRRAR